MAIQDPEPGMHRPAVKAMSTLDWEKRILLGIGYVSSVVAAFGALLAGFSSLGFDPSVACARSLGRIDQGCKHQIALLQASLFTIGLTVAPASALASVRSPTYSRRLRLAFLPLLVIPPLVAVVWFKLLRLAG
jgi:hypothetical protein